MALSSTADALRRLDASRVTLNGLSLREPSLDDVFINLTGHRAEDVALNDDELATRSSKRKARA